MNYHIPVIETERLILRPVSITDVEDMFEYASDLETVKYVSFPRHTNRDGTRYAIDYLFLKKPEHKQFESFAMVDKQTEKMIGTCDFTLTRNDVAELGYILNKCYWNQGYVKEAARAVIDFAFSQGIRKLTCRYYPENIASGKVMEGLGFIREGVLRKEMILPNNTDKGYVDIYSYSLLKEDFYE